MSKSQQAKLRKNILTILSMLDLVSIDLGHLNFEMKLLCSKSHEVVINFLHLSGFLGTPSIWHGYDFGPISNTCLFTNENLNRDRRPEYERANLRGNMSNNSLNNICGPINFGVLNP
jgi:hypothetical protein